MPPRKTKTSATKKPPVTPQAAPPSNGAGYASSEEMAQMREHIGLISAQLAQLTQMMTSGGKLSAAQFASGPGFAAGVPLPGMPPAYPQVGPQADLQAEQAHAYAAQYPAEEMYYVRIKPYDPARKQLRIRQYFDELGRIINGGTGQPGDIPEWVPVTPAQAQSLAQYKQLPEDPMSPLVLDIVTPEQRQQIDAAESQVRAQTLGLAGMAPHAVLSAMQRPGMVAAHVRGGQQAFNPQTATPQLASGLPQPSLMAGAVEYHQAVAKLNAAQQVPFAGAYPAQPQPFIPDAARAGRAAALEGVAPPPPLQAVQPPAMVAPAQPQPQRAYAPSAPAQPPAIQADPSGLPTGVPGVPPPPIGDRGVSEDLTGEARASQEAAEAIRSATPLLPGTHGGFNR